MLTKLNSLSKKKKVVIGLVTLFLLGGITVGSYSVYASQQAKKMEVQKNTNDLEKEISRLTTSDGMLKTDISEKEITDSEQKAKDIGDKKLIKQVEEIRYKYTAQEALNGLFTQKVLNGNTVKIDEPIVDTLTKEAFEKVKTNYYKQDVLTSLSKQEEKSKTWYFSVNAILENAENQLNQLDVANASIEKVYKDHAVVENVSVEDYENAKTEVEKVKNETIRNAMNDKLTKVKEVLNQKEAQKVEEQKQAEEATKNAENQAQANEQNNNVGNTTSQNATNNGTANGNTGGGGSNYSSPSQSGNGGGNNYTAPNTPSGGGSTSGGSGGTWSTEGSQTQGGIIPGGATGGSGDNTWTGGTWTPPY